MGALTLPCIYLFCYPVRFLMSAVLNLKCSIAGAVRFVIAIVCASLTVSTAKLVMSRYHFFTRQMICRESGAGLGFILDAVSRCLIVLHQASDFEPELFQYFTIEFSVVSSKSKRGGTSACLRIPCSKIMEFLVMP